MSWEALFGIRVPPGMKMRVVTMGGACVPEARWHLIQALVSEFHPRGEQKLRHDHDHDHDRDRSSAWLSEEWP